MAKSIFKRIFGKHKANERRSLTGAIDDFWYSATPSKSGQIVVTNETAYRYLTIYACISLISGDCARLPLKMYRRKTSGDKDSVTEHSLYDLLRFAPNENMSSFFWIEHGLQCLLSKGNWYNFIERDKYTGDITGLYPIYDDVEVKQSDSGKIFYDVRSKMGTVKRYAKKDIFHVPGFGFNGLVGMSPISQARQTIASGLAMEDFGQRFFTEGTHPSGVIEYPEGLGVEADEEYCKYLRDNYAGMGTSNKLMILPNGEKFKSITVPPEDAQFIESRNQQKIEICGIYRVPPHKIALHTSNANRNNLEQENKSYIDGCLIHWTTRIEQAIAHQLLSIEERKQGYFLKFSFADLLRGDLNSTATHISQMIQNGVYSINEGRRKLDLNAIEGGDDHYVQVNMQKTEDVGKNMQVPSPSPAADRNIENKAVNRRLSDADYEKRVIASQDTLASRYRPILRDIIQKTVNKEVIAINRQIGKLKTEEDVEYFRERWLPEFYDKIKDNIRGSVRTTFDAYIRSSYDISREDIAKEVADSVIDSYITDYVERFAERYAGESMNKIRRTQKESNEAVLAVTEDWSETKADKKAFNETTRAANGIYAAAAFSVGLKLVWTARGSKTCPYCLSLNGRVIASGETFANNGDDITPDGQPPMRVQGRKKHPPLHRGCDCYLRTEAL